MAKHTGLHIPSLNLPLKRSEEWFDNFWYRREKPNTFFPSKQQKIQQMADAWSKRIPMYRRQWTTENKAQQKKNESR